MAKRSSRPRIQKIRDSRIKSRQALRRKRRRRKG